MYQFLDLDSTSILFSSLLICWRIFYKSDIYIDYSDY